MIPINFCTIHLFEYHCNQLTPSALTLLYATLLPQVTYFYVIIIYYNPFQLFISKYQIFKINQPFCNSYGTELLEMLNTSGSGCQKNCH